MPRAMSNQGAFSLETGFTSFLNFNSTKLAVAARNGNGSVFRVAGDGVSPALDRWNRLENLHIFGIHHTRLAINTAGDNQ